MTSYPPVARCTLHPLKGGMQRNGLRLGVVANETELQRAATGTATGSGRTDRTLRRARGTFSRRRGSRREPPPETENQLNQLENVKCMRTTNPCTATASATVAER